MQNNSQAADVTAPTNILFVEDSAEDVELMLRVLGRDGIIVHSERVCSEGDVRDALIRVDWNIVLCDFAMPGFDGMRALQVIRERNTQLPVIFVSGAMGEETAVEAMQAGAQDYVMKHNLKRLAPAIKKALCEAKEKYERFQIQDRISFLAYHDPLTGLANRSLLMDRLALALHDAQRNRHSVAVVFIDLDRFKMINDTLGHSAGDQLLIKVAARIASVVRRVDTAARMAGDEFALVLGRIEYAHSVARVVEAILKQFSTPISIGSININVKLSIGVSVYPADGASPHDLLQKADMAMYRAKRAGGGCEVFTSAMQSDFNERSDAESLLRCALDSKTLLAYFQPMHSLPASRVTAMETLLRWPTERGIRLPSSFIALAEQTGMMLPIGEWILRTACEQCKAWRRAGFESMRVSVNISPTQLLPQNALTVIKTIVAEVGLDPSALELEINARHIVSNDDHVNRTLRGLRDMGATLAIDDFGAGYSSLAHFRHVPIDVIKIDGSFIHDVATNNNDREILKAIVGMAKSLRVEVVGKGVETPGQLEVLQEEGCDYFQGYYLSRPMPEQDVCAWLYSREVTNASIPAA